jgi:hypothetical protein
MNHINQKNLNFGHCQFSIRFQGFSIGIIFKLYVD